MTKDLALITTIENPTVLNSKDFIVAIRETLEKNELNTKYSGLFS